MRYLLSRTYEEAFRFRESCNGTKMARGSESHGKRGGRRRAATVLLSGGIDSAACAKFLLERRFDLQSIFIDYGQLAARRESRAASAVAAHLGISLHRVHISPVPSRGAGELPGRNAFFVCTAILTTGARPGSIALGLHGGTPYYDCSEPFISSISRLTAEMTDGAVSVLAPFATWSKKDVYDYFTSGGIPIGLTYSCEAGCARPCGVCLSCRDRRALGC